jgi:hypothetical protein
MARPREHLGLASKLRSPSWTRHLASRFTGIWPDSTTKFGSPIAACTRPRSVGTLGAGDFAIGVRVVL